MVGLFHAARAGDQAAVAEIHRLTRVFARELCRGGGPPGAFDLDWEDVAQEAGLKVFGGGLEKYEGRGTEQSYLYTIVKTTMINMLRSSDRRRRREEATGWNEVVTTIATESRLKIGRILSCLPDTCRDLIVMVFFYGFSYADLATRMSLQESSVRSKLSRCIQSARESAIPESK